MQADSVLFWIIYFIVTVLVAWIALSLIILWFKPAFLNADGAVNWWTTLWVAALIIVFAWLIMVILMFIISLFRSNCDTGCSSSWNYPDPRMWRY